ncbi:Aspartate/glutamate/uridylate kinase [Oceanicola granulosus HTCC2516]|uniref:aspartate kinase n=1 Tax=Oceanicola granulosus (strain ATCC BAA-861 / DSM 15982 / KCTC 12143 / HTCC2516) TaxID=314256 RepID=Q2CFH7_OCEGH|nr:aspartate kinase [Oceanicola granulosus]EAR51505.1 Aspartate/glutamate/uridylate kinase [Oceanicola granulosus HTCC2516]
MTNGTHTVEKIGGTTMSKVHELIDPLFIGDRDAAQIYNRVFVVSAFGGITNLLLEHKKSGKPGVYALFINDEDDHGWLDALNEVSAAMREAHAEVLEHKADIQLADDFVRDRMEGARSCLFDIQRICSYGHFRLSTQLMVIRELLSGLGEAHSAFVTALMLQRRGVAARFVDLTGWRDEAEKTLEQRIAAGLDEVDLTSELPIVTGYAQCTEGLMKEFDRGYSEVTFSRIAAQSQAREAIIHKEFHLSSADPKIVGADAVKKLGQTNYDVADQLSNMGMEAIHPSAAKTLRRAGVPLRVANAFDAGDPGTLIDDRPADKAAVEIVTGLPIVAIELFEQDMVGVKGYDAAILEAMRKNNVWIVSKSSNANTITHFVAAVSRDKVRRVVEELEALYPAATITDEALSLVSVIGRDLRGLRVLSRGLAALDEQEIDVIAAQQTSRRVDSQFVVARDAQSAAVKALHDEFFPVKAEATKLKAA